ncbi:U3 small nucleolar RNA-associated protein 4 homolog [Scaptodrosophila lebanonensis]|uniref:U3 small nucleolar RNA-associated protein 4 homolog n=1 Tax=Drosophila lebanonensis TaxID=7225 RepID=A0A6J2UDM2_DROLE|nr:U3 small nucleolar RNA-associated protein 4 homolog [Scaptodrosophila lebanonensis]
MKARDPRAPEGGTVEFHGVRFYKIKPKAITCLAYNKLQKLLALSREDGRIEIWDLRYAAYLERVIPQTGRIKGLAWAGKNRLFSASLAGALVEWNLNTLLPRYELTPTGNALWCLDVNSQETELAIGSDGGHINIFGIEHDEITYKTMFQKLKRRIVCCRFDKSGKHLVTGSRGYLRIWNVSKGTMLHIMTMRDRNVSVRSLVVLSDFTIITGDSAGYVTVWNGANGTQVESNKILARDVDALAVNEEEDRLFCSGNNPPIIRILSKTQIKREESQYERWIKNLQRDVHKHPVKALALIDDCVISGGQDGILCISSGTRTSAMVAKYVPFLHGSTAALAPNPKWLLLRYQYSLSLWQLGASKNVDAEGIGEGPVGSSVQLPLWRSPRQLLQLNTDPNNMLIASAISADGTWLCYSTTRNIRLSCLQMPATKKESIIIKRITEELPAEFQPATHIQFTKDSDGLLILHAATRQLRAFSLAQERVKFTYSIDLSAVINAPITHVEISQCTSYVVVASVDQTIAVWHVSKGKRHEHLLNLPRYKAATTALALHEEHPLLVIAYADGRIVEYDLTERRFTCETDQHFVENSSTHCIRGVVLDAQNPNIFIVYNEVFMYVLEKVSIARDETVLEEPRQKAKRLSRSFDEPKLTSLRIKLQMYREHLTHVCRLGPKEIVTIGLETKTLLASLPPPVERKKFGAA